MNVSLKASFVGESGMTFGRAWAPSSSELAVVGLDDCLTVWNIDTGDRRSTATHSELVSCVSWSPNGRTLVGGSSAGELLLYDSATCCLKSRIIGHNDEVSSVAFSPDGRILASGANDNLVRLWSADTLDATATATGHTGLVRSVSWSPSNQLLASGGHDGFVRVWDAATGAPQGSLADHRNIINQGLPSRQTAAYSHRAATILRYECGIWRASRTCAYWMTSNNGGFRASRSHPTHKLATIDQMSTVRIWDLHPVTLTAKFDVAYYSSAVSWSPNGCYLTAGGRGETEQVGNIPRNGGSRIARSNNPNTPMMFAAW